MTEQLTIQAPEFPTSIHYVPVDTEELSSETYSVTNPEVLVLDQTGVEKVSKKMTEVSVSAIREYLENPSEKLTIAVPPIGAIPALARTLQQLRTEVGEEEMKKLSDRIDFVYCIPHGAMGEKTMKFWKLGENGVEELDGSQVEGYSLLIEDIFDSLETYDLAFQKFPNLVGIAPVGKGPVPGHHSTKEHYDRRFGNGMERKPYLRVINGANVDLTAPGINLVTLAENRWIKSGLGMNGGTEDLDTLDEQLKAEYEVLERLSGVCTFNANGTDINLDQYRMGLEQTSTLSSTDENKRFIDKLVRITILNNRRKVNEKQMNHIESEKLEKEMVDEVHGLIIDIIHGNQRIDYKKAA